ncbi:ciliary microtubule inner protein 4 isoform X2 [Chroicocephalus ridibundus]|uniref:ciliary microtubule inner protein 4 isoform X2 n=1 Tax=Chroicocephalus ridibundus TaxID=1192867 RepID=UPI002FDEE0B8
MDEVREGVVEVPASLTPDVAESHYVLSNSTSVEPEKGEQEHLPEECPSSQRTSQRSPSSASWKISKSPVAQGTAKNSTSIKSQASASAKCVQTKKQSFGLQAKTPPTQSLHSISLEEEGEETSTTEDPIEGHEPRGRNSTYHRCAISRQRKAEDTKYISNVKPVAGQHQTLRSRGPGSSQKTIKASCKKAKETCGRLSARASLASLGPDGKAEWKLVLEEGDSLVSANSKYKFASACELTSDKEERRALCEAALIMGQKRLSDRTEMLNTLNSTSFADYNQLGFNLRSNIFQGGPLESRSLMKDSYTPDIIQKAARDPKNWHGRRTDELGKWHQKNALNLNLQKALEDKYGKKKGKP